MFKYKVKYKKCSTVVIKLELDNTNVNCCVSDSLNHSVPES